MKAITSSLFVIFICVCGFHPYALAQQPSKKIVTIDWTQTETLLALGIQPIAAAQKADYHTWVGTPPLPKSTVDIGLRTQPNLERLSELQPDRIFISPMFQSLTTQLSRIAPVTNIALYRKGNVSWSAFEDFTRTLGKATNTEDKAETLIQSASQTLAQLAKDTPANAPPLLMVQFMDARHVRVFGEHSMYKIAADKIGLSSAWQGHTNSWGFALVGINKLMDIKGQIVVIKPLPVGVEKSLQQDELWHYLIKKTGYPLLELPPAWSFGAIPSTVRFANLLVDALNKENQ
jgi:iron complex transport system substrate-binding protein